MKVCTIIVSYNFEKWIDVCLSSLETSSVETEIIVVDNASSDKTCEIIRERYPKVTIIENRENLGFGRANNIGFKYTIENNFDYVLLLNQDAWVDQDTIEKLIDASVNNPNFGIISPVHLNGTGENLDFGFSTYTGLKTKQEISNIPESPVSCDFINAAIWLIPISVIKKVGEFAPIFPHYGEDVNYYQRIKYKGFKTGFVTNAFAYHDREKRETDASKFFYMEYIYFLTEAVNPLYTPAKSFAYSVMAAEKKAFISLFSGKLSRFVNYQKVAFKLLQKSKAIIETRKTTI